MQIVLIAVEPTLSFVGSAHAAEICEVQATAKRLVGAAKTNFVKKCLENTK